MPGRDRSTESTDSGRRRARSKPTGDLADDGRATARSDAGSRELECLATGIYFESKSEPLAGQLAVGQVIANRANSGGRFPSSYCGVLFQRGQFSLRPRPFAAVGAALEPAMADRGRDRQDRRPGSQGFAVGNALVLPRAPCFAGLAAEARRLDRQPHLLPLSVRTRVGSGRARLARFHLRCRFVLGQPAMATQLDSLCFADAPPIAAEVARGVTRLFCRQDLFAICEMPLPNGRRADMMAIDAKGGLTIVEIKVAKADLRRRRQMDRLSRILRPLLLGGAAASRAILRGGALSAGRSRADRRRPLRCGGGARGGAPAAGAGPAQGRVAALRPPRRAAACRRRSTRRWATAELAAAAADGFGLLGLDQLQDVAGCDRRARHNRAPNSRRRNRSCRDRRPPSSSSLTIRGWRCWTATISGVSPILLAASTLAPRPSSHSTASSKPTRAAAISGVSPPWPPRFGSAPLLSRKPVQSSSRRRSR